MNKQDLDPSQIVLDVILRFSTAMPSVLGFGAVLQNHLFILAKNHRNQRVTFGFPVVFEGEPFDGDETTPPRFVLFKLGATVWKVSPSINHPLLHAYLTVIDVPDPAPWETR